MTAIGRYRPDELAVSYSTSGEVSRFSANPYAHDSEPWPGGTVPSRLSIESSACGVNTLFAFRYASMWIKFSSIEHPRLAMLGL